MNKMTNYELLKKGQKLYGDNNNDNAKWILAFLNGLTLEQLYANLQKESLIAQEKFYELININLQGKPLAYIIGYQEFLGRKFKVNNYTFIPRTETQELVENILYFIDDNFENVQNLSLLDLATGSGAIGITLALEVDKLNVIASDISDDALLIAKTNAQENNCDNIKFIKSDMLNYFTNNKVKFDILVCNPPYISHNETISKEVKEYEPHLALFASNQGLYFYEEIFQQVTQIMNEKYLLAFEFGWTQKAELEKLVNKYFNTSNYQFMRDLNDNWRMLFIFNE